MKRGSITTDTIDFKRILKDYYEQFMPTNMNKLNGAIPLKIQFAKIHKEEVDNLKWTIGIVNIKETKPILDNLPEQNQPGPGSRFPGGPSAKHLRKDLYQFSTISSRRYDQGKYFVTHLMKITLISN